MRLSLCANGIDHALRVLLIGPFLCFLCLLELLSHACKQTLLGLGVADHLLHDGGRQARFCRRGEDLCLGALVGARF